MDESWVQIDDGAELESMHVAVVARTRSGALEDELSLLERDYLARQGFGEARRCEWMAGRVAAHRILARNGIHGGSILADPSGSPLWIHETTALELSLSHDGDYIAVAWRGEVGARLGVDVCIGSHREALDRILRRFRIAYVGCDSVSAWAALECAIKIRGKRIGDVLDDPPQVMASDGTAVVQWLEEQVLVSLCRRSRFALAWGEGDGKPQEGAEAGENQANQVGLAGGIGLGVGRLEVDAHGVVLDPEASTDLYNTNAGRQECRYPRLGRAEVVQLLKK